MIPAPEDPMPPFTSQPVPAWAVAAAYELSNATWPTMSQYLNSDDCEEARIKFVCGIIAHHAPTVPPAAGVGELVEALKEDLVYHEEQYALWMSVDDPENARHHQLRADVLRQALNSAPPAVQEQESQKQPEVVNDMTGTERKILRDALQEAHAALVSVRADRPSVHSDEVWSMLNRAINHSDSALSSCPPKSDSAVAGNGEDAREKEILAFASAQWGVKDMAAIGLKVGEEAGEVAGAIVKIPEGRAQLSDLDKELGDILIVLSQLAALRDTTLSALRSKRFEQIKARAAMEAGKS